MLKSKYAKYVKSGSAGHRNTPDLCSAFRLVIILIKLENASFLVCKLRYKSKNLIDICQMEKLFLYLNS